MDQYTKIILTILTCVLCILIGQNAFMKSASAQRGGDVIRIELCGNYGGVIRMREGNSSSSSTSSLSWELRSQRC